MMCDGYLQWSSVMCAATMTLAEYGGQDLTHLEISTICITFYATLRYLYTSESQKTKDTIGTIFTQPARSHQ